MKMTFVKPVTAVFLSMTLWSCQDSVKPPVKEVTSSANVLDTFALREAPADPKMVSAVFADPTPGAEVVIAGEIMGRKDPFVEGRGLVVLGDPTKITPCNRIPGDECKTPWDCCCDDPAELKKSVATIQFLDAEGNVHKSGLKGYKGIKEQSYLTVSGTIAEGSSAENLLINAKGFHVAEKSPYENAKPVWDEEEEEAK